MREDEPEWANFYEFLAFYSTSLSGAMSGEELSPFMANVAQMFRNVESSTVVAAGKLANKDFDGLNHTVNRAVKCLVTPLTVRKIRSEQGPGAHKITKIFSSKGFDKTVMYIKLIIGSSLTVSSSSAPGIPWNLNWFSPTCLQ